MCCAVRSVGRCVLRSVAGRLAEWMRVVRGSSYWVKSPANSPIMSFLPILGGNVERTRIVADARFASAD